MYLIEKYLTSDFIISFNIEGIYNGRITSKNLLEKFKPYFTTNVEKPYPSVKKYVEENS